MTQDPIVAEVRAVREQLFKECGHSLEKLVDFLQTQRKQLGLKVVRLQPRPAAFNNGGRVRKSGKRVARGNTLQRVQPRKRKAV